MPQAGAPRPRGLDWKVVATPEFYHAAGVGSNTTRAEET